MSSDSSVGQTRLPELSSPPSFDTVYDAYFRQVIGWMQAMNVPSTDMEDAAQEVFLVVQRKLSAFRGDNIAGWLYRIADLTARNYRRIAWFKHLLGAQPSDLADLPAVSTTPAANLEEKEDRRAFAHMLSRMSSKRRETLLLFEVEGYSGQEIATLQGVPIRTVWTRLHHARKELLSLVAARRKRDDREAGNA